MSEIERDELITRTKAMSEEEKNLVLTVLLNERGIEYENEIVNT